MKNAGESASNFANMLVKGSIDAKTFGTAVSKLGVSVKMLDTVCNVGFKALSMIGNMASILAFSFALNKMSEGIAWLNKNFLKLGDTARNNINELTENFENSKSELDSLNEELKTTQDRITELSNQGTLSVTDEEELKKLKESNEELERKILLKERETQLEAKKALKEITSDSDKTTSDAISDLNNLNKKNAEYKNQKNTNEELFLSGQIDNDEYEYTLKNKVQDKYEDLVEAQEKVSEAINNLESDRQMYLDAYGDTPLEEWSAADHEAYKKIESTLNKLKHKLSETYSDSEYIKYIIKPVVESSDVKDLNSNIYEQIKEYFANGQGYKIEDGQHVVDIDALKERFGEDIIEAMNAVAEEYGVDIGDILERIFNSTYKSSYDTTSHYVWKDAKGNTHKGNSESEAPATIKEPSNIDDVISKLQEYKNAVDNAESDDAISDETKELATMYDNMMAAAEAGNLTAESIVKIGGVSSYLEKTGLSAESLAEGINSIIDNTKQLSSMKTGVSSILSAYDEKRDAADNRVGSDTLSSMYDTLDVKSWSKEDLKVWDDYKKVAASSTSSLEELKVAQDNLATSFVYSNNFLTNLDEEHAQYYKDLLTEMGVTNADEVVQDALQRKLQAVALEKQVVAEKGIDLANATYEEVAATQAFINASADAQKSLLQLALQKMNVNGHSLMFDADLDNLASYVRGILGASKALDELKKAKAAGPVNWSTIQGAIDEINTAKGQQRVTINTSGGTPTSTSGSNNSGSNSNKNKYKATAESYDWIAVKLEYLGNKATQSENKIERFNKTLTNAVDSIKNLVYGNIGSGTIFEKISTAADNANAQIDETILRKTNVGYANTQANVRYQAVQAKKQADLAVGNQVKSDLTDLSKKEKSKYKSKYGVKLTKKGVKYTKKQKNNIASYVDKMQKGQIGGKDIEKISDPVVKAYLTEYMNQYNNGTSSQENIQSIAKEIDSLFDQYKSNIESKATAPTNIATEAINKLSDALEILKNNFSDIRINLDIKTNVAGIMSSNGKIDVNAYRTNTASQIQNIEDQNTKLQEAYSQAKQNKDTEDSKAGTLQSNAQAAFKNIKIRKKNLSKGINNTNRYGGLSKSEYDDLNDILNAGVEQVPSEYLAKIDDDTLASAIRDYNKGIIARAAYDDAANTAQSAADKSSSELNQNILNSYKAEADAIKTAYDNQIAQLQHGVSMIDKQLSKLETRGATLSYAAINQMNDYNEQMLEYQKNYEKELQTTLKEIEDKGGKGSQQWYDTLGMINDALGAIADTENAIWENLNKINDISKTIRDTNRTTTSRVMEETSFMLELLNEVENFEPTTHILTDSGAARLVTYSNQMKSMEKVIKDYDAVDINNLRAAYEQAGGINHKFTKDDGSANAIEWKDSNGKTNYITSHENFQELENALYDNLMEDMKNWQSYRQQIIDWQKQALEAEKSIAQKLVDGVKDAMNAAKDLKDYQKSITEKTNNIQTLQQQIAALSGNKSENAMSQMQSLNKQLLDAQNDLEETENDRMISEINSMLDEMMTEYGDLLTSLENNQTAMLSLGLSNIAGLSEIANNTLVGINDTMNNLFGTEVDQYDFSEGFNGVTNRLDAILDSILQSREKEKLDAAMDYIAKANNANNSGDYESAKAYIDEAKKLYDSGDITDKFGYKNELKGYLTSASQSYISGTTQSSYNSLGSFDDLQKNWTDMIVSLYNLKKRSREELDNYFYSIDWGTLYDTDRNKWAEAEAERIRLVEQLDSYESQYNTAVQQKNLAFDQYYAGEELVKKAFIDSVKQYIDDYVEKDGDGKITDSDDYQTLYKMLQSYPGNLGVNGSLEDILKSWNITGFSTGGIVGDVIRKNNDDGFATLKKGEAVFTPVQTQTFTKEFMPAMNDMIASANIIKDLVGENKDAVNNTVNTTNNVEATYSFNIENVTNAKDMIKQIQTSSDLQNLLYDTTVGKSLGTTRNRTSLNKY